MLCSSLKFIVHDWCSIIWRCKWMTYWSFIRKHYLSIVNLPEVGVKGEVADCGGVPIGDREKDSWRARHSLQLKLGSRRLFYKAWLTLIEAVPLMWLFKKKGTQIQGDFFNWASPENVSRLALPINPSTGPPLNYQSMRITKHLDFLLSLGGASLGLYRFLKLVT